MLQLPENFWNLSSDFFSFWAVVEPVLFCAFLLVKGLTLTGVRPINIEQSLLRPSTFQEHLPVYIAMLFSPFLHSLSFAKDLALVPAMLLLSTPPTVHFFQHTDRARCISFFKHLSDKPTFMSVLISSLNISVCRCGHLTPRSRVSHITAPAGPLTCFHV